MMSYLDDFNINVHVFVRNMYIHVQGPRLSKRGIALASASGEVAVLSPFYALYEAL